MIRGCYAGGVLTWLRLSCVAVLCTACPNREDVGTAVAQRQPAEPKPLDAPRVERVSEGRLYLPIYSHIYARGGAPDDLAITISVRNVSTERVFVLESVQYYDTSGKLLENFLEAQAEIKPLETVEFFIPTDDQRGGSGANVIVAWHAESPVLKPLVEAVMVRAVGANQAYAFSTRAIEIPADAPMPAAQ